MKYLRAEPVKWHTERFFSVFRFNFAGIPVKLEGTLQETIMNNLLLDILHSVDFHWGSSSFKFTCMHQADKSWQKHS